MHAARYEREKALEKAKALIAHPGAYTKVTSFGDTRHIKNLRFDKKTGEIVDGTALELDVDAIKEGACYDVLLTVSSETH